MAVYHFVTNWHITAPIERVWQALNAPEDYGRWWPSFVAYEDLTPGTKGVGARAVRTVRGRLPYALYYTTTITQSDAPRELAYDATGDLQGHGRFVLTPAGEATEVAFYWDVQTTRPVMNLLAPLLRPLFAWNHNIVMSQGERGLNDWLARQAQAQAAQGEPRHLEASGSQGTQ